MGRIAKSLAQGLIDQGSKILYKANVRDIILEHGKAVSHISFGCLELSIIRDLKGLLKMSDLCAIVLMFMCGFTGWSKTI